MPDQARMRRLGSRVGAFVAFVCFCLFSSLRDVLSEHFFKDQSYNANPIFILFVYSVVTQAVAAVVFTVDKSSKILLPLLRNFEIGRELLFLNFFTLTAFLFYFLAINSPLGAALNGFIDYGSGPILTALVGAYLTGERVDWAFARSAVVSLTGLALLAEPRVSAEQVSFFWALGVMFALLSSLSSAIYRVHFKVLLDRGLSKTAIIFLRLVGLTLVLGLALLVRPDLFQADLLVATAVIGLFGFTIPLFLIINVIQRVEIKSFAMMLFLFPLLTFVFSMSFGYTHFYWSDLLAMALILLSVAFHEVAESRTR